MIEQKPNPGHGYVVRELLGSGYWKKVYRAVRRGERHDFALACFIHKPVEADKLLKELRFAIRDPLERGPEAKNVAKIYDVFQGEDQEIYLVEELLYRRL